MSKNKTKIFEGLFPIVLISPGKWWNKNHNEGLIKSGTLATQTQCSNGGCGGGNCGNGRCNYRMNMPKRK